MGEQRAPEFDPETVPWLDRYYFEIDSYVSNLPPEEQPDYDLREKLVQWMRNGYVAFPGLVETDLVDAYLADIGHLLDDRESSGVKLQIDGFGEHRAREFPPEAWEQRRFRVMDFHNASTAGKSLALHPRIVEFLKHVFRQTPVAMQTLTFIYSSEQDAHQDFPYVTAEIPSHLAATWIALEDVDPAAGPLFYYPGSHTVEKFDWGRGLTLTPESERTVPEFIEHLHDQVASKEHPKLLFCPKKGDVFFWHSALVHGGSPAEDPTRTRRSLVTHYSTVGGYSRDRRAADQVPTVYAMNGGLVFADPTNPDDEDRYRTTPLPPGTEVERRDFAVERVDVHARSGADGSRPRAPRTGALDDTSPGAAPPARRSDVADVLSRAIRRVRRN